MYQYQSVSIWIKLFNVDLDNLVFEWVWSVVLSDQHSSYFTLISFSYFFVVVKLSIFHTEKNYFVFCSLLFSWADLEMSVVSAAKQFFTKHPLVANSVIYGSLYFTAELSQQTITRKFLVKLRLHCGFSKISNKIFIFHDCVFVDCVLGLQDKTTRWHWREGVGEVCSDGHLRIFANFIQLVSEIPPLKFFQ